METYYKKNKGKRSVPDDPALGCVCDYSEDGETNEAIPELFY